MKIHDIWTPQGLLQVISEQVAWPIWYKESKGKPKIGKKVGTRQKIILAQGAQ